MTYVEITYDDGTVARWALDGLTNEQEAAIIAAIGEPDTILT